MHGDDPTIFLININFLTLIIESLGIDGTKATVAMNIHCYIITD